MENIRLYLETVKSNFDEFRFVNGDCHNLAIALFKIFGGELWAIIRHEYDTDDELYSITYSHMIFTDKNDINWDIDGDEADERWCQQWDDFPDEDGHTSEFEYKKIEIGNISAFLNVHNCKIDEELVNVLFLIQ